MAAQQLIIRSPNRSEALLPRPLSSQELTFTLERPHDKTIHLSLRTDDGLVILLIALMGLAVAALGLYSVLTVIKVLRRKE